MNNQTNILRGIDNSILQIKEMQQKIEQNTALEQMAILLISECRFEEAAELLADS